MRARVLLVVGRVHVLRPPVLVIALEPARFLALPTFAVLLRQDSLPSSPPRGDMPSSSPCPIFDTQTGRHAAGALHPRSSDDGMPPTGSVMYRPPQGADITLRDVEVRPLDLLEPAEALGVMFGSRARTSAPPPTRIVHVRTGDRPFSAGQDTCEPIRAATTAADGGNADGGGPAVSVLRTAADSGPRAAGAAGSWLRSRATVTVVSLRGSGSRVACPGLGSPCAGYRRGRFGRGAGGARSP